MFPLGGKKELCLLCVIITVNNGNKNMKQFLICAALYNRNGFLVGLLGKDYQSSVWPTVGKWQIVKELIGELATWCKKSEGLEMFEVTEIWRHPGLKWEWRWGEIPLIHTETCFSVFALGNSWSALFQSPKKPSRRSDECSVDPPK